LQLPLKLLSLAVTMDAVPVVPQPQARPRAPLLQLVPQHDVQTPSALICW